MGADVFYRITVNWISVEYFSYKFFAARTDKARYQIIAVQNLFVEFVSVWIFKWQITTRHCVQDDPAAPYIRYKSLIAFASYHFWSCIAWTTASCFECLSVLVGVWKTKIDYFYVASIIQEQVFRFQISVTYAHLMNIFDPWYYLLEKFACFGFL